MSGTEGPIPIFLFRGHTAVQFHYPISGKPAHLIFRSPVGPERMVHLDEIAVLAQQIKLELLLKGKQRNKIVEKTNILTTEDQLVIFEKVVSVFIDIDLKACVKRMPGENIVVGKSHNVVPETSQRIVNLCRSVMALVQRPGDNGMSVKIGTFPAICCVEIAVGVIDIRTGKRSRRSETVNRAYRCHYYREKCPQQYNAEGFP